MWPTKSEPKMNEDKKLDNFRQFEKELKQEHDAAKQRALKEARFVKGDFEKAVMVELVRTNPWLWEINNAKFGNVEICEHSWKYIAKRMSESDDYYYVWKYQRMWQSLIKRFLVEFTEKREFCSHFDQIKAFVVKFNLSLENQILYIKKIQELSIHFVNLTNAKLAKENKRYELRPDVIQGYSKIINIENPRMKLEESENAPYFAAMQELLKKR